MNSRYLGGIIEFHGNALVILGNNAFTFFLIIWFLLAVAQKIFSVKYPNAKNWHGFYAFASSVVIATTLWNVIVYYPIMQFRQNVGYEGVLEFLEKEHGIIFDPYMSEIDLSARRTWFYDYEIDRLSECVEACIKNFRDHGLKQSFLIGVPKSGSRELYVQKYKFVGSNVEIETKKYVSEKKLNGPIHRNLTGSFRCEETCKKFGVNYKINVQSIENGALKSIRRVSIYMNKIDSWLVGFVDDTSGISDREMVMQFDWLDVMSARSKNKISN